MSRYDILATQHFQKELTRQRSLHLLAVRNRMFIRMSSLPDMSLHRKGTNDAIISSASSIYDIVRYGQLSLFISLRSDSDGIC